MENTFFYTFSTISQTLAGAIALLAGFVLYRLQLLNMEIYSLAETLESWVSFTQPREKKDEYPGKDLFIEGNYSKLLDLANQVKIPPDNYRAEKERERLGALLRYKASFIRKFYISLYLTSGLITASIFALIKTPSLCANSYLLSIAAFWFFGCILSYMWLLHSVFREKSIK